jgi:hypothetical protein
MYRIKGIEALDTIEPTRPVEDVLVWLLIKVYRRWPRGIMGVAPTWVSKRILTASEGIGVQRSAVWLSES